MEKVIVTVGDIHGCLEEFDELLKVISYNPERMRLVLLGDLMDRGPDAVGCVRRARELKLECIMGNHEDKTIRWRKHESNRLATGKANPMKRMSEKDAKANAQLTDQDISWMKSLPLKLNLFDNWWAVHAGMEPGLPFEKQLPEQIMRVRFVNEKGRGVALNPDKSQPANTEYWSKLWKGPQSIVYGHCVHENCEVRRDVQPDGVECLGVDTGCVFGGSLTCAMFNEDAVEFVSVPAKRAYYALRMERE